MNWIKKYYVTYWFYTHTDTDLQFGCWLFCDVPHPAIWIFCKTVRNEKCWLQQPIATITVVMTIVAGLPVSNLNSLLLLFQLLNNHLPFADIFAAVLETILNQNPWPHLPYTPQIVWMCTLPAQIIVGCRNCP